MSNSQHWNEIYSTKSADNVGWYTPHLNTSLDWIRELGLKPDGAIIDVGGGASTLVDDLLGNGHNDITVLDLSRRAMELTQERLGARYDLVTWMQGDVTEAELPVGNYRLWHDRAVFHFLIRPQDRQRYRDVLLKALQPDGFVIVGAFSPDAPPQCSGLPVQRYTAESLSKFFAGDFELRRRQYEMHITPSGLEQSYVYCLYQRTA
jgi:SAM-dependent methyltransferase